MAKKIQLTDDYFAIVDDCDYAAVQQFNWYKTDNNSKSPGRYVYAARKNAEKHPGARTRNYYLHRFVMERMLADSGHKPLDGEYVQHLDGNGLNNRRENLVLITAERIPGIKTQVKRLRRMKDELCS
jgi:hypothetical protein